MYKSEVPNNVDFLGKRFSDKRFSVLLTFSEELREFHQSLETMRSGTYQDAALTAALFKTLKAMIPVLKRHQIKQVFRENETNNFDFTAAFEPGLSDLASDTGFVA